MEKDESLIPKNHHYCYDFKDGKTICCPYWEFKKFHEINLPYCSFLEKAGISNNTSDEDFDSLVKIYGSEEQVWEAFPLDLLWDQIKECNINIE
jgi:hypothetical protein